MRHIKYVCVSREQKQIGKLLDLMRKFNTITGHIKNIQKSVTFLGQQQPAKAPHGKIPVHNNLTASENTKGSFSS